MQNLLLTKATRSCNICFVVKNNTREWLSGGAPPCQGGGRGFDPRLALERKRDIRMDISFLFDCSTGIEPAKGAAFFFDAPVWAPIYPILRLSCLLGYVEMSYVSYFPVLASFRIQNTSLRILFFCFSHSLGYEKCFCISYFLLFRLNRISYPLIRILISLFLRR